MIPAQNIPELCFCISSIFGNFKKKYGNIVHKSEKKLCI